MTEKTHIVRLYDGGEGTWLDVFGPASHEECMTYWKQKTANGTRNTKYQDFDYWAIFPADTKMVYSTENFPNGVK